MHTVSQLVLICRLYLVIELVVHRLSQLSRAQTLHSLPFQRLQQKRRENFVIFILLLFRKETSRNSVVKLGVFRFEAAGFDLLVLFVGEVELVVLVFNFELFEVPV